MKKFVLGQIEKSMLARKSSLTGFFVEQFFFSLIYE